MAIPIITHQDAVRQCLSIYFDGNPCKHGHTEGRFTKSKVCVFCKRNVFKREDPQKSRARARTYRLSERFDKDKRNTSERRQRKLPHRKAKEREYVEKNKQRITEDKKRWVEKNPGKAAESSRAAANKRRALKVSRADGSITKDTINLILKLQGYKCINCRVDVKTCKWEIDHIMPLNLGGLHILKNIQVLCTVCNRKKAHKHPIDWAQQNGRLC
jgi:hypothetical protein